MNASTPTPSNATPPPGGPAARPPSPSLWARLWAALLGRPLALPMPPVAPVASTTPSRDASAPPEMTDEEVARADGESTEVPFDEATSPHVAVAPRPGQLAGTLVPHDDDDDDSGSMSVPALDDGAFDEDDEEPSQAEAAWLGEDIPTLAPRRPPVVEPEPPPAAPAPMPSSGTRTSRVRSLADSMPPEAGHDPFADLFDALEDTSTLSSPVAALTESDMTVAETPPPEIPLPALDAADSVEGLLASLTSWQAQVDAERTARAGALSRQADDLEERIRQLAMELEQVRRGVAEVEAAPSVQPLAAQRAREGIVARLGTQAQALHGRALAVQQAEEARKAALEASLAADPEIGETWAAFTTFDPEALPDGLPESYRSALLEHHRSQGDRVRAWFATHDTGPVQLEGAAPLKLDAVLAVDGAHGAPALISVVLPVSEQVSLDGEDVSDDLQLQVAARAIQALCELAVAHDVSPTQVAYGGHDGLLALELELPAASDDLAARVRDALLARFAAAPELADAAVTFAATTVSMDHLLPPTDEA